MPPRPLSDPHICSRGPESCPACGHKDSRDGPLTVSDGGTVFFVRCRICEAEHPDQSNWDYRDCDACRDEELSK